MQTFHVTCRAAAVGVLGLLWVVTAVFTCPERCDCVSDRLHEISVFCDGRGLTDVPANIPSDTTHLFLSYNTIQSLSHADFSNLTSLERLYLYNNNISSLPAGVFSHLTRLLELDLSDNHIADLPDGVFSNLTSLIRLSLSNNNISSLPAGVFSHLTRLGRLPLFNNHITDLPDGVFSILTSLEYLDLSNNKISSLPAGVFSHLTRLERLDLSDNHIADLPDGVFSNLTILERLYLTNNNISSLPADIKHLSTLTSLDITGNPWRCDCSLHDIMTSQRVRGSIGDNSTCSSPPHMKDDALTDVVSGRICNGRGVCPTGSTEGTCACDVGWTGPYCGEELNIALGKNATQSSTDAWNGAEKAVDGDYNECATTTTGLSSPWWQVDLAGFYRVSRVSVQSNFFGSGDGRVRVGPNENLTQNDQCGQTFQLYPPPPEWRIAYCEQPLFGRYVSIEYVGRIYSGFLLCEVEVYVTDICCDDTIKLKNGQVTATDGYCSKSDIQFSCDTGYELVGNPATCQKNGSWDRQFPTCQRTCCDNTTRIKNGQITVDNDYCSGNSIQFSCDTGYQLVGSSFASCRDKNWDREIPTCQQESRTSTEAIIGGTSAGIAALLIVAAVVFTVYLRRRRKKRKEEDYELSTVYFVPDDVIIHRRRLEEMVPLVPARPQFPKLETDPSRVTLGEKIGSGAFGIVYRATLTRDDRTEDVVVKTLKENASEDDKLGFLEEIRAVVDLGVHKNLLGLLGCCTVVRDHLYLITELMPYGDLKSFLRKCREEATSDEPGDDIYTFEVIQMYQVARQIARGMDHIARSRYVHGDLAARNVLVGKRLHVKISDFGLAEDIYSRGYRRQDRLQRVPWKWMAPERLEDGKAYTTQSDVWSFGIVLYEICTLGGDPYPGVAVSELKDRLQAGFRMDQPEDCPRAMYDLMQQCWRWQPIQRPLFSQLYLTLDKHLAFYGPEYLLN